MTWHSRYYLCLLCNAQYAKIILAWPQLGHLKGTIACQSTHQPNMSSQREYNMQSE